MISIIIQYSTVAPYFPQANKKSKRSCALICITAMRNAVVNLKRVNATPGMSCGEVHAKKRCTATGRVFARRHASVAAASARVWQRLQLRASSPGLVRVHPGLNLAFICHVWRPGEEGATASRERTREHPVLKAASWSPSATLQ